MSVSVAEGLSPAALAELERCVVVLEGSSLPVRLAALVGGSVDALKRRLPDAVSTRLDEAVTLALQAAMRTALLLGPASESFGSRHGCMKVESKMHFNFVYFAFLVGFRRK